MDFSLLRAAAFAFNMAEGEPDWPVVVITGILLVFAVLVLLYLIISFEGVIFTAIDKKKAEAQKAASKPAPAPAPKPALAAPSVAKAEPSVPEPKIQAGIPGEIVAAIAAALASMEGGKKFAIRSVKRAKKGRNVWSSAGVMSNTEPF